MVTKGTTKVTCRLCGTSAVLKNEDMKISDGPGGGYILRFRKGAKLKVTDRNLEFSNPKAQKHWFEVAKENDGDSWVKVAKKEIGRG